MSGETSQRPHVPTPTDPRPRADSELHRWSRIYAGGEYYYGEEPGPVARRAVRYHRPFLPHGGTALDAGCGEGQDLAFLAERGYQATGVEFTPPGIEKSRRFLQQRGLTAEVIHADLRTYLNVSSPNPEHRTPNTEHRTPTAQRPTPNAFDLVLAVNTLQFLGEDTLPCLDLLMQRVSPGGVIGVSLFGREPHEPAVAGTVSFVTWDELLKRFLGWQKLEGARLWQWNPASNEPQAFLTLIARKAPPAATRVIALQSR